MNVSLANKILKLTPKHILHPSSPSLNTPLPLSTGATIPAVGLATWQSYTEPDQVKDAVLLAIKSGYRHFDTTSGNEGEVGRAIKEAVAKERVKREELFVTTRLESGVLSRVDARLDESLKTLGLEYVDLFLVDFDETSFVQIWELMEKLPATNKTKAIGVANFSLSSLEKLLSSTKSIPAVIQIESNPYKPQQDVLDFCSEKNIHVIAYSPFRSSTEGSLFNHEIVTNLADKHACVPENVLLSWHVARGSAVLVEDVILGGSEENRKLVQLDAEDMAVLGEIVGTKGAA